LDTTIREEPNGRLFRRADYDGRNGPNGCLEVMAKNRYFDDETGRLEPIENPFGPRVLPVYSE